VYKLIPKGTVYKLPRKTGILVILPEMTGRSEITAHSNQEIRRFRERVIIASAADYSTVYAGVVERVNAPLTRWLALKFAQDKART